MMVSRCKKVEGEVGLYEGDEVGFTVAEAAGLAGEDEVNEAGGQGLACLIEEIEVVAGAGTDPVW